MALAGTAWIDFRGNFTGLGGQAAAAGAASGKSFAASFKKFSAVAVPAAVIVGLGAAVSKAAQFEKQMSAVGAVSNATNRDMDRLRKKALQLGADTAFSANEAGQAMEELVKAGVSVENVLNGAADATTALAAAGAVDLPTAARIASNAMNAFNLAAGDMAGVADTIAGAANASAIDVNEFGMSLSQVGAVANLVGLSFEDTALAITAMGNAGIRGSDAGTSLKTMLNSLQPSTKRAWQEFKRLGIITADGANQFYDAQGNVKSLADISEVLKDSLAGMTAQQKQASLEMLFGSDAIRAAAVVSEEGAAGFRELAGEIGKISAEDVAEKRLDNLSGSIEKLSGSWDTLLISTGTPLLAPIRAAVDGLTEFFNLLADPPEEVNVFLARVRDTFSEIRDRAVEWFQSVDWVGVWARITDAMQPFIDAAHWLNVQVLQPFVAWAESVDWAALLTRGWEEIQGAWDRVTETFLIVRDAVKGAWDAAFAFDWAGLWADVQSFTAPAMDAFRNLADSVMELVAPVRDHLLVVWRGIAPLILPVLKVVGVALGAVAWVMSKVFIFQVNALATVIGWVASTVLPAFTWALEHIVIPVIHAVARFIETVAIPYWTLLATVATRVFQSIADKVTWWWNTVVQPVFNVVKWYVETVLLPMWSSILTVVTTVWDGVYSKIQGAWGLVSPIFDAIVWYVRTVIVPVWGEIADAVGGAFDRIPGLIQDALRVAGNIIAEFLRGAASVADLIGLDSAVGDPLQRAAASADAWGEARQAPRRRVFARGGYIEPGWGIPGKDSVPAMLMPGEVVIRKSMVDRYGVGNLLALNDGRVPGFAVGGQVLLNAARMLQSQGARISEHPAFGGIRGQHARGGYHYSNLSGTGGDAFDANFGPGGQSSQEMAFFDAMAPHLQAMGLRVLWRVKDHFDHLHADIGGSGGGARGPVAAIIDVAKKLSGLARPAKGEGLMGLIGGTGNMLLDKVTDFVKDKASSIGDWATGVGGGPVKAMVKTMADLIGWKGGEWNALDQLITRESSWNPNAQNPTSTAYGLFQFLNSTWGSVGATKTSDPRLQAIAGFKYIQSRYGTPPAALAFHDRNNWYGQGGEVTKHARTFDSGGVLEPGWNLVKNMTGAKEPLKPAGAGAIHVYIGGEKIDERIDTRIEYADGRVERLERVGEGRFG